LDDNSNGKRTRIRNLQHGPRDIFGFQNLLVMIFRLCRVGPYREKLYPRGLFLEGPEKFSYPKSRTKISNLLITKLFYSYILNTNRRSLHTRSFRRIHWSVFKYRLTKNGFSGPKRFRAFEKRAPSLETALDFGQSFSSLLITI